MLVFGLGLFLVRGRGGFGICVQRVVRFGGIGLLVLSGPSGRMGPGIGVLVALALGM